MNSSKIIILFVPYFLQSTMLIKHDKIMHANKFWITSGIDSMLEYAPINLWTPMVQAK